MSSCSLTALSDTPLSLQDQCLLTIACHTPTYSIETLALIPPRLRAIIGLNMCAIDLHRIEECPSFLIGLGTLNIETLWKRRYETTLVRFSNIASLDLDLDVHRSSRSLSLTSKDRYLVACLLNIPHTYSITDIQWGVALFGLTDVALTNGHYLKDHTIHTIRHGLHCYRGRASSSSLSCNFISGHYLELLDSRCSWLVGKEWPLAERLSLYTELFPNWVPPYIPIQYDELTSSNESEYISRDIKGAIVYSGWYEKRHYAEISEIDTRPIVLSELFKGFFKNHSKCLDTIVLLAPAVQKCVDENGDPCIVPLSITTTSLTRFIATSLPMLKHLSIAMHWGETSALNVLPQALTSLYNSLQTLHLRIVRPKFNTPCTYTCLGQGLADLYHNCRTFEDLILQGVSFDSKGFIDMMIAYLSTPPTNQRSHHSLVLRTIKIWNEEEEEEEQQTSEIDRQIMPTECHFTKSLHLHRIQSGLPLLTVFSSFEEIFLNKLTLATLVSSAGNLFPSSVKFHVNTIHIENTSLYEDTFECLQPLLSGEVQCVNMSIESVFPLTLYKKIFNLCQYNLRQLHFNAMPGTIRSLQDLEFVFVAVFSFLPATTLAQLELNVSHVINILASQLTTGNQIGLNFIMQSVVGKVINQLSITTLTKGWRILHKAWRDNAENYTKIKSLQVPSLVLEELYEELSEMSTELIEDII